MANDSGHVRNIKSFERLISSVQSFGSSYNPTNSSLNLPNLQMKLSQAKNGIDSVKTAIAPNKAAIKAHEAVIEPLDRITTRIINYYASTKTDEDSLKSALNVAGNIQGSCLAEAIPIDPRNPECKSADCLDASQRYYRKLIENFDNLIAILQSDLFYAPDETELSINRLKKLSNDLKVADQTVTDSNIILNNAHRARDNALYAEVYGIVDTAYLVKNYIKTIFGADSFEYRQVKELEFSQPGSSLKVYTN